MKTVVSQFIVTQFISDVYRKSSGDAVFVSSLNPMRCRVVSVKKAVQYAASVTEGELFFSVSSYKEGSIVEPSGKGRTKQALVSCGIVHLDFDSKRFDDAAEFFQKHGLPEPSWIFRRMDRNHVYWLLDKPCTDMDQLERVTKALAKKTGADVLPAQPAALMRVPYTTHIKKGVSGPGYKCVSSSRARYPLSVFLSSLPEAARPSPAVNTTDEPARAAPRGFENILLKDRKKITAGAGRSGALYQFALRCRDFGLGESEALDHAVKFNDLFCEPPEAPSVVRHQVTSAYRYAKHPPGRYLSEKPERVAKKFEDDTKIAEALAVFVYVAESETLINTKTGLRYSKTAQIENALCYAAGVKTSLQYVLTFRLVNLKDRLAFRPGEPKEFETAGVSYFNTYEPVQKISRTKIKRGLVKIFESHLRYLTNTEEEFEHLRRFLACSLLRPGKKIKHSLLLISTHEGIGKSVLQSLAESILKSVRGSSYVVSTSNTEIARGHNSWIESKFLTFVHELGQSEKFTVLDQLKNWITEPRVRISDKYIRSFEIENYSNFIFFSNSVNALPVSATDRRFFTVINRRPPQPPAYYDRLIHAFDKGLYSIVHYLEKHADTLNVNAAPPHTESKVELRSYSRNELTILLDECLHDPGFKAFFDSSFSLTDLADRIQDRARTAGVRFSHKQTAIWLRENSFVQSRTTATRFWKRDGAPGGAVPRSKKFKTIPRKVVS